DRPADAKAVAKGADSPAAAAEIYLLSLLVIDEVNPEERAYLQTLATELGLSPALVAELEKQTRAAL
ncbi:MAG: tellurite resistance TerB family protein, partial [Gammaproteobacteria bacterium]|nr:tellurite resistance TerB family protein [Gammaproteobacteria bacterium]